MQATQRYSILSLMQAVLGAVTAAVVFAAYKVSPNDFSDGSLAISIAGIGLLAVMFYLSVFQILKRSHIKAAALILSCITAINILLITLTTGGLDSPYYALWLLGIVIAGLFGVGATVAITAAAAAFFGYEFYIHISNHSYIVSHLVQLILTLATAGVAEWIHIILGRSTASRKAAVTALSGQLTEESLKSNTLIQSVGEGVIVINAQRQIQLFNPAAVSMTGWDENSAQTIDYRLVLNLHDAAGNSLTDETDPFTEVWREGKNLVRSDLTMQTKGGNTVAISLSLSPMYDKDHTVTGGIALFRDISAEKEVQRQKDEFVSTASHEMRTPVAAIEGYLSLAMNPQVASIDDRAKGYLEKAHSSTKHLGDLFQDLLSITKLEDKTKMGTQEIFDLTALVKEACSDMQFTVEKKGLRLEFGQDGQNVRKDKAIVPVYAVKGNPQRLREVVMNLMENATKFTAQGGIRVLIGGNNDTVTVSVIDTGVGIAPEDISHLFQKFYRINSEATKTIGGTGLGLYLCRTIIEILGGKIWIESKIGEGSAFKFSLPRQASEKIGATKTVTTAGTLTAPTRSTNTSKAPMGATDISAPVTVAALTQEQKEAAKQKALAAAGLGKK